MRFVFACYVKMDLYFRNCKHCGRCFFKIEFFCKKCLEKLEQHRAPIQSVFKTPEIMVRPLYIWKEKESIVADLIHGLKGGKPEVFLKTLAVELAKKYQANSNSVVVPVPSSKVGVKDHAYMLAKYISEELELPLWSGLEWVEKNKNQKFLNKTERFVAQMKKTQRINRKLKVILIDDLVTTGATGLAAHKAFKSPNPLEVWALACRL